MALRELSRYAAAAGAREITGKYIPTERNGLVKDHYSKLGFEEVASDANGTTEWRLRVNGTLPDEPPMRVRRVGFDATVGEPAT
jgi:predicted enzyme involved in methoxymalonyl-ACP biosynthesis